MHHFLIQRIRRSVQETTCLPSQQHTICNSVRVDALRQCVESGDVTKMREMLNEVCREYRLDIDQYEQLLLDAEQTGKIPMIKLLLEQDPRNKRRFQGKRPSALWLAVLNGHRISAELLVRSGSVDLHEPLRVKFQQIKDSQSTILHVLLRIWNPSCTKRFINLVVDHGADLEARDSRGRTPLHYAVRRDRVQETELLLEKGADVNVVDNNGETPLLMAARSNKATEFLPLLMRYGADVTAKNSRGWNVLYYLTKYFGERVDLARVLIEKGALLNDYGDQPVGSFDPLRKAICMNKYELVKLYLDNGADLKTRDSRGKTVLHCAVAQRQVQLTELLLERGADVNAADNFGKTPLLAAVSGGYKSDKLLALLMRHGADVTIKDSQGCNVLYHLTNAPGQRVDLAEFLIKKGALLNDSKTRQLYIALCHRKYELAKLYLNHGAELNDRNSLGRTMLYYAVGNNDVQMIEWLLEKGANVNVTDNNGETPVFISVRTGRNIDEVLPLLMKHGANINVANNNGETPLLVAAKSHRAVKLLPLLITHGADVTATDSCGKNALYLLTFTPLGREREREDLARLLIEKGVSLNDRFGPCLPILAAICLNRDELVNLYLEHGVDVNSSIADGHSLLHLATNHKMPVVLKTLLDSGAKVNLKTDKGRTALHFACEKSRLYTIGMLLQAGADMLVEDQDGKTPFALIEDKNIKNPVMKLMLLKLALKKAYQPSIELKDERIIEKHPELQGFYKDCFAEIDRLKSMKLTDTYSVFDLLGKSACEIFDLIRDCEFKTNFKLHDLGVLRIYNARQIILAFERTKRAQTASDWNSRT